MGLSACLRGQMNMVEKAGMVEGKQNWANPLSTHEACDEALGTVQFWVILGPHTCSLRRDTGRLMYGPSKLHLKKPCDYFRS